MKTMLRQLTDQRLDFITGLVATIPPDLLETREYSYIESKFCIEINTEVEWLQTLFNWSRYYAHLFPGESMCIESEQQNRWKNLKINWENLITNISSFPEYPAESNSILALALDSFYSNRWVHDFIRADQAPLIAQSRYNLSLLFSDYCQIHTQTKSNFKKLDFDFYLNNEVFNYNPDGIIGLTNANLINAPTGVGKTRSALMANLSQLCWSNDLIPFAAKKVAVFVRTRSQTQAFLKESKRLGLSFCCPISMTLGCTNRKSANRAFIENFLQTLQILNSSINGSLALGKNEAVLVTYYPVELYTSVSLAKELCTDISDIAKKLYRFQQNFKNFQDFMNAWIRYNNSTVKNEELSSIKDFLRTVSLVDVKQKLVEYLLDDPASCEHCSSNCKQLRKIVNIPEFEKELKFFDGDEDSESNYDKDEQLFETLLNKNSDINNIAKELHLKTGHCCREISRKSMQTSDVVILTYNWLLDLNIAQHAAAALKLEFQNLNPTVAAICDEAHFLFDYNEATEFNVNEVLQKAALLWHVRLQYLDPGELNFSKHLRVKNPHHTTKINWDDSPCAGALWYYCDNVVKFIAQIVLKMSDMAKDQTTPRKLFQLLTGIGVNWYPSSFYTCMPLEFNFQEGYKTNQVQTCYSTLNAHLNYLAKVKNLLSLDIRKLEKSLDELNSALETYKKDSKVDWRKSCKNLWQEQILDAWEKGSSKNLTVMKDIRHLALTPYKSLEFLLEYCETFLLMAKECIYSVGQNNFDDRILGIASTEYPQVLTSKDIFDFRFEPVFKETASQTAHDMMTYLNFLAQTGYSKYQKDFDKLSPVELLSFFTDSKHGSLKDITNQLKYKTLQTSFKVNKPFIQTALQRFSYITFLTGTPPDIDLWRAKSGFRYLSCSDYQLQVNPFIFLIDSDIELKQATKSSELLTTIAAKITQYTKEGMTLVGYPSKATLLEISKNFPEYYSASIKVESENLSLDDIQEYVESNTVGSIHVALGGRFVEGIEITNLQGSSLINQILVIGVPFNPPSEEQEQVQAYFAKQFGWDQWQLMNHFMFGPAARKIRQAIGRSVRNLTDRGKIILLDKRYRDGKMLRRALKL